MDKAKKEAIQVTKEIVVKFIETGRVSPSNISEVFPAVFEVVSSTVCEDESETEEQAWQYMQCSPNEHAREVSGMFSRIARWYDFLNHLLSGGMDFYWRQQLVKATVPGKTGLMLDLAAGTMDVSLEIVRQHPQTKVAALDYCRPMLTTGRKKLTKGRNRRIFPVHADGRTLPLPDNSVDCATISFGIRNIIPREEAFKELNRVLVPGGRLCILEFGTGKHPVWKGFYNLYLKKILPMIGKVFSGDSGAYQYLADTIMAFPTAPELSKEMMDAGFDRVYYKPMTSGIVYLHVAQKKAE